MKIQIPYKCTNYTENENMNKNCKNRYMCRIYYGEICEEYKENENDNSDNFNNNDVSDVFQPSEHQQET